MAKRSVKVPEIPRFCGQDGSRSARNQRDSHDFDRESPQNQGLLGHEQSEDFRFGKETVEFRSDFGQYIVRARIPNERRARENGRGRPRARPKSSARARENGRDFSRFPRARSESWANSREISGIFPDFPLTCAHILARARTKVSFFWVGCEDGRGKPLRAYPIIWR